MFPHLQGWRVNLGLLQEAASKELANILERCEGTKAVVWDSSLSGPAGLLTKNVLMEDRNVIKNLPLRPGPIPNIDIRHIIFISRPELKQMDYVADIILNENGEDRKRKIARKLFHLYFLPRKSELCTKHLKVRGVFGTLTNIGELECDFFPVDNDLISMELKEAYKELVVDGDSTCLYQAACGLVNFQKTFGRIPKVYGKGDFAQKVWEYAKAMGREEHIMFNSDKRAINQMIILDRSIDLMSILATQLTYEGLIDEIYGIHQTTVHLPADRFTKGTEDEGFHVTSCEKKSIILNSGEELFAELRDKNFNEVGIILSKHAKSISSQLDERHQDKSVQEMKRFVERLPAMLAKKQSVGKHYTIAEMIKEITDSSDFLDDLSVEQEFMMCNDIDKPSSYIENLIAKKADFRTIIRLICIQCVAASGLKAKILDYYKRELIQVYGIEVCLTIGNLEKAGLLRSQSESRVYAVLRKTLNLTVDDVMEISPKDISYVHSFYAPLTVRIVEQCINPTRSQLLKTGLNVLPGQSFEDFQAPLVGIGGRRTSLSSEISNSDSPRVILVFFVGGCTFAEVSALRFLAQQEDNNIEFIIATTKLVNKHSFLDTFIEDF